MGRTDLESGLLNKMNCSLAFGAQFNVNYRLLDFLSFEGGIGQHRSRVKLEDAVFADELGKLSVNQFKEPMVTELWMGLGGASISKNVMLQNVPFISMLKPEALRPASEHGAVSLGMSPYERRKYQIEANKLKTSSYIFYRDDFLTQKSEWNYPFISGANDMVAWKQAN